MAGNGGKGMKGGGGGKKAGGNGGKQQRKYTVCKNPACQPYDDGSRAWRFNDTLHDGDLCKFCSTPFIVRKRGGGGDGGWMKQDAKGRMRQDNSQEGSQEEEESRREAWLREKLNTVEGLEGKDKLLLAVFPPKVKSQGDILKDALARVERANTAVQHQAGQVAAMEKSFRDRCEALLTYRAKLEEHSSNLTDARQELAVAQKELGDLQNANNPKACNEPKQSGGLEQVAKVIQDYNPNVNVAQTLSTIQGLPQLQPETLLHMQTAFSGMLKNHFDLLGQQIQKLVLGNNGEKDASGAQQVSQTSGSCNANAASADAAAAASVGGQTVHNDSAEFGEILFDNGDTRDDEAMKLVGKREGEEADQPRVKKSATPLSKPAADVCQTAIQAATQALGFPEAQAAEIIAYVPSGG